MKSLRFFPLLFVAIACFASPVRAADEEAAGKYLQGVGDQAIGVISNQSLNKDQKQKKLEGVFIANVDIPWVARFVMGRFWSQATDDQKARYLKEYQNFLILHYTSRFSEYTGGSFKITGSRDDGDNEYTVSMQMKGTTANSEPVLVDYRIRKEAQGFRIFDIIVEGVSLITTQRSEFSSVIANHDIEYLITQLSGHKVPVAFPDASAEK